MRNQSYKFFMGSSMLPTIKTGAKIKLETVSPEKIQIGDIVIIEKTKLICHRIVGKYRIGNAFYFWEKGDNNHTLNFITQDKILGRVTEIETVEKALLKGKCVSLPNFAILKYRVLSVIYGMAHNLKLLFFKKRQNKFTKKMSSFLERMYY